MHQLYLILTHNNPGVSFQHPLVYKPSQRKSCELQLLCINTHDGQQVLYQISNIHWHFVNLSTVVLLNVS
jgi:hypothetical protein